MSILGVYICSVLFYSILIYCLVVRNKEFISEFLTNAKQDTNTNCCMNIGTFLGILFVSLIPVFRVFSLMGLCMNISNNNSNKG